MQVDENGIARRYRVDLCTPAELAIREAMLAVEKAGAHLLLTEAVLLLEQARNKVADYVELDSHPQETWIWVNGQEVMTNKQELSYADVIRLAFPMLRGRLPLDGLVTFSSGHVERPEGILVHGETIKVVKGLVVRASWEKA